MPCIMSKLQFVFGILSWLDFFEDQETHTAFSLLVGITFVIVEQVRNPEPSFCLESAVLSWKCLEQIHYLIESSMTITRYNVPLAFLNFVVESVFLAILSGTPRLRHVALAFFPARCDSLILMTPKLLQNICRLSLDDSPSVQEIALQIISRLAARLPAAILLFAVSPFGDKIWSVFGTRDAHTQWNQVLRVGPVCAIPCDKEQSSLSLPV